MEVTNISHDHSTGALTMTFVPETPEGKALTGCINELILAFPNEPYLVAKYSIVVAKMLGFDIFGPAGDQVVASATQDMKNDPKAMAAVAKGSPAVASQVATTK